LAYLMHVKRLQWFNDARLDENGIPSLLFTTASLFQTRGGSAVNLLISYFWRVVG